MNNKDLDITLFLNRFEHDEKHGTFGTLTIIRIDWAKDDGYKPMLDSLSLFTLEPPDIEFEKQYPRIPAGSYTCSRHHSPNFGEVWKVNDVPGRSDILFHWLNWYKEPYKGTRQTRGCIGVGLGKMTLEGIPAISKSKDAFKKMMHFTLGANDARLIITENFF